MNKKTEMALKLLNLGYSVIPVTDKKIPYKGFKWRDYGNKRRASEIEVINWFEHQFPDACLAVCTGKMSNLTVIEADLYKPGGADTSMLPDTPVKVKSARGGIHYWYKYSPLAGTKTNQIGSNIDSRNDGGYVMVPPSEYFDENGNGGSYTWINDPIEAEELPPFPEHLLIDEPNFESFDLNSEVSQWDAITNEGGRDEKTTQYCGKLLREVKDLDFAWTLLKNHNLLKNNPPLSEGQLKKIFNSISSREGTENSDKLEPILYKELKDMEFKKNDWLVDRLILSNDFNILAGDPGVGKTWLYLILASKISSGEKFLGFKTRQTGVLIIDKENKLATLQKRLHMIKANENANLHLLCSEDWIINEASTQQVLSYCQDKGVGFVIIDSLRRIHGKDENDSTTINEIYKHIRKLLLNNITVLITHHLTKGEDPKMRGSGDIKGSVDSAIIMKTDGENRVKIEYDKARNFEKIKPLVLEIITDGEDYYNFKATNYVETADKTFLNEDVAGFIVSLFFPGLILPEKEILDSVCNQLKCKKEEAEKTLAHLVSTKRLYKNKELGYFSYTLVNS